MKLADCLSQPGVDLARMAELAGVVGLPRERESAVRSLAGHLTERGRLRRMLDELTPEQRAALKVVVYHGDQSGITVELCKHIVNQMAGKRRQSDPQALTGLQDRGLIFVRSVDYRQRFFVPQDLLGLITEILSQQMMEGICLDPSVPVAAEGGVRDLLEDLHRFLAYVFKNEVPLTQQGQIFRRHLRALNQVLTGVGDEEDDENDSSPLGRYPEPLGLFVDFALDRHLITRADGMMTTTADLQAWLRQPEGFKRLDLFEYWQDRYYYPDLQTFLSLMESVGDRWVLLRDLAVELEPMIHPSQRSSFVLRIIHHLNFFLGPLGAFDLGRIQANGEDHTAPGPANGAPRDLACRLTSRGAALLKSEPPASEPGHRHFILQANFELVAPRPLEAMTLWNLEVCADLLRADTALIYQINRQSIYRALKAGMSADDLMNFLARGSSTGVPQNVEFDLRGWIGAYGQVYLQEVTLLRCATVLLAQTIKASRRCGRFILGEITPTDLIVDATQTEALMSALLADGLLPLPSVQKVSERSG